MLVHGASPGASAGLATLAGPLTRLVPVPPGSQLPRRDVAAVLASSRVVAVVAGEEVGVNVRAIPSGAGPSQEPSFSTCRREPVWSWKSPGSLLHSE